MEFLQTLANRFGGQWTVVRRETPLVELGGVLLTLGHTGHITLNSQLSKTQRAQGQAHLLERLATKPTGISSVETWRPATN